MALSRTSFTTDIQPLKRRIVSRQSDYWRAIPLEAFSVEVRQALASIPTSRWWIDLPDPDDLDLVKVHLLAARVITPRPWGGWQIRHSCRHLIHKARQWNASWTIVQQLGKPEDLEIFNPEFEPLTQVRNAQRLFEVAFTPGNPFPGCPGLIAELRGIR